MKRAVIILAIIASFTGCSAVNVDRDFEQEEIMSQTDSTSNRKGNLKKGLIIIHIPPTDPKV